MKKPFGQYIFEQHPATAEADIQNWADDIATSLAPNNDDEKYDLSFSLQRIGLDYFEDPSSYLHLYPDQIEDILLARSIRLMLDLAKYKSLSEDFNAM